DLVETASIVLPATRVALKDPDPQVETLALDAAREAATALGDFVGPPEARTKFPPAGRPLSEAERKDIQAKYEGVLDEFRFLSPLADQLNKQSKAILEFIERLNGWEGSPHTVGGPESSLRLAAIDALENIAYARLRMVRRLEGIPLEGGAKRDLEQFDPLKEL